MAELNFDKIIASFEGNEYFKRAGKYAFTYDKMKQVFDIYWRQVHFNSDGSILYFDSDYIEMSREVKNEIKNILRGGNG